MFNINIVMFEYFKNNFVFIVIFVLENLKICYGELVKIIYEILYDFVNILWVD